MKTENGGVHYLLPELFLPLGSIHHQIYIDAMQPHPISGHIPLNVCIWCIIQSFSQFFVNGKQLSLQVVTIIRNPYLEAIAHCFFSHPLVYPYCIYGIFRHFHAFRLIHSAR